LRCQKARINTGMKKLIHRQKMILDFVKSCDEILAEDPENTQVRKLRGLMYSIAGEYDKAIRDFEQSIQEVPTDTMTYYLKSHSHYDKGEFDLAKRDYMRALKMQHGASYSDDEINKAVILDDNDLADIKAVIEHEKSQAILLYFNTLNAE